MIPFWLLVVIAGCGLCLWMPAVQALQPSASLHKNTFRTLPLYNSILDRLQDKLLPSISKRRQKGDVKKTEAEELVDFVDYKPWRAPKVKYLTYHYRPFEDSWMERFHNVSDDTINIYSTAYDRTSLDGFRLDEVWSFPWVWTRVKAERMGWIYKHFERNLETMTVQEHMELESFFSEFDMPYRWGLARVREVDLINMAAISLAFFTQIHGIKPTDLGLRPDEQVRTCPVQFHNCISSTNDPSDADHFAPPFRWTRSKSPDQAFDEIKKVYMNYPVRGLRYSNGWIDRGGWKPQSFSGNYFYAQAESLSYHFTDDIELLVIPEKREVQFRSASRLGQVDFDVHKLRYNQFVRMLSTYGGWEVAPLEKSRYLTTLPFRGTQYMLDKTSEGVERITDRIIQKLVYSSNDDALNGATARYAEELQRQLAPYYHALIDPVLEQTNSILLQSKEYLPFIDQGLQQIEEFEQTFEDKMDSFMDRVDEITSAASTIFSEEASEAEGNFVNKEDTTTQKPSILESVQESVTKVLQQGSELKTESHNKLTREDFQQLLFKQENEADPQSKTSTMPISYLNKKMVMEEVLDMDDIISQPSSQYKLKLARRVQPIE